MSERYMKFKSVLGGGTGRIATLVRDRMDMAAGLNLLEVFRGTSEKCMA